jgi:hypothetical protein
MGFKTGWVDEFSQRVRYGFQDRVRYGFQDRVGG